jgi:mannosyltransferase OCH1-like enzyme
MRITSYRVILLISALILSLVLVQLYRAEYSIKQPVELFDFPHHIPRRAKQEEEVRNGVPLIIYESWKSHEVPKGMRDNILRLLETNPEFDYYLYSDEDCAAFIADNFDKDVLAAFHTLKPGAYKSDLWRYCILYKLGGVYLDIKYYSTVPLIKIIDDNATVYVRDADSYSVQIPAGDFSFQTCLYNGFMVSPPKNEIFKLCIDEIVESCKKRLYRRNNVDVTGPCLLGRIVQQVYTSEYFKGIPFVYGFSLVHGRSISYKGTIILKEYDSYRLEQNKTGNGNASYYANLYFKRNIYN